MAKYFLKKQNRSIGIPEKDIIDIAIESLGLNQVKKFTPEKNIIEYFLNSLANDKKKNIELTASEFSDEVTRESPAPGGGSVSAYVGSLGASLGAMVANLSSNKRGWENQVEMFSHIADQINVIRNELLLLVDEDSNAFNMIMVAFKLPNNSEKEKKIRLVSALSAAKKIWFKKPSDPLSGALSAPHSGKKREQKKDKVHRGVEVERCAKVVKRCTEV